MPRTLGATTPADFAKLRALKRMQAVALGLLILMAVVFGVSFALQERIPWMAYIRAASEGGMVGALADWFAVTAIFRHPLGIPIPHTNLISRKKDEVGQALGTFIEDNFLGEDVIHDKLTGIRPARTAGEWLADADHARRIGEQLAVAAASGLDVLEDADVQALLESLARTHLVDPDWSPTLGRAVDAFIDGGHHEALVTIAASRLEQWLREHPDAFDSMVSRQLPSWVPGIVDRFVDQKLHSEATEFVHRVAKDPAHPARAAIGGFLTDLAVDLQQKPELREQVEAFKHEVFDSPRIRALASSTWQLMRAALTGMLEDPASDLRVRIDAAIGDFGARLQHDAALQEKIDIWVVDAAEYLVRTYRHDIASVVTDTVERWDANEASEKIELLAGKDLQYIRINGTVVGALAGLVIFAIATLVIGPIAGG